MRPNGPHYDQSTVHKEVNTLTRMDAKPNIPTYTTSLSEDRILDATERVFRGEGYDACTIRRIARDLDCAVGSIYRYFTDKRQLLLAVTHRIFAPVIEVIDSGGSITHSARMYHDLASASPQMYRLMFWLACPPPEKLNQIAPPADATVAGNLSTQAVGAATATTSLPDFVDSLIAGWARRASDEQAARRCWAVLHGAIICGLNAQITVDAIDRLMTGPTTPQVQVALATPPKAAAATAQPHDPVTPAGAKQPRTSGTPTHTVAGSDDITLL